jgi:hypothetical protein
MVRDLTAEPLFPIEDIQGDILVGLPKRVERLLFFSIDDADDFKEFLNALEVTSVAECLVIRDLIAKRKAAGIQTLVPTPGLNVAFTYAGLTRLGIPGLDDAVDELAALRDGMAKRTEKGELTDPPAQQWQILRPNPRLHGVFILTGASEAETTNTIALRLAPVTAGTSCTRSSARFAPTQSRGMSISATPTESPNPASAGGSPPARRSIRPAHSPRPTRSRLSRARTCSGLVSSSSVTPARMPTHRSSPSRVR